MKMLRLNEIPILIFLLLNDYCQISNGQLKADGSLWSIRTNDAQQIPVVYASEATLLTPPHQNYLAQNTPAATAADLEHTHPAAENMNSNEIPYDFKANLKSMATDVEPDDKDDSNIVDNYTTKTTKNRYKIARIATNCSRELFEMNVEMNRPFHGLMYAKDFAHECRARGKFDNHIVLRLPTSGCGVRVDRLVGDTMELSVGIMFQIEEKLRQSIDILKTIRCKLPLTAMGLPVAKPLHKAKLGVALRNGRMQTSKPNLARDSNSNRMKSTKITKQQQAEQQQDHQQHQQQQHGHSMDFNRESNGSNSDIFATSTASGNRTPSSMNYSTSTPRVRVWLELGGPDGSGSVVVGQATTLSVRAIVPGNMGVRIVDCAALDGLGESTQQLLDEHGCPIDEQVMPALRMHFKPFEEGWSIQSEDDLLEKTYTATFPAFKFPDRERLHVSCGVQLCIGPCPDINCDNGEKLMLNTDKHLARIDVFNSLAVTAPQIEIDRLQYERYHNTTEEYRSRFRSRSYGRTLVSEGTLCLSVSKLALSFCILGLIFLIAVIVAVCSLIRSRRHTSHHYSSALSANSSSRLHPVEVCTSMFSSSSESAHSARFGSKLFIPYYHPNTLPYGRVY